MTHAVFETRHARYRLVALALTGLFAASACKPTPQPSDTGLYGPCYAGQGICLGPELVGEPQRGLLEADECPHGLLCVPRSLATGAEPASCASVAGSEGRCLLARLPLVAKQLDDLPTSFCSADQRCVPCYDPFSGAATGACELPGDPGPSQAAKVFGRCCEDAGRCLPKELVAPDQQTQLARDACAADELCVPQSAIDEAKPATCDSLDSGEGRCLPTCLPLIAMQLDRLPASSCAARERCAPCYDPIFGAATGACALAGDPGPAKPPVTFATCCDGAGRCLPSELVAADQRESLGQGECPKQRLCAPQALIDKLAPRPCASVAALEGRCLASCLPLVEKQLDILPRSVCAAAERCVPCFDPFSGESTGACSLPGDPGPSGPARSFESCCGGAGYCLPPDLVPAKQRTSVAHAECDQTQLCVPRRVIDAVAPTSCQSIGAFEGRCLPSCLPLVAAQVDRLPRAICGDNERCAPCYDPFSGDPSGACSLPGDAGPRQPAGTFASCCGASGHCLPPELVASEQQQNLAPAGCSEPRLCVPDLFIEQLAPPSCDSIGGAEGRCLPTCLPLVAAQVDRLPRSSCAADQRCAACFDPFSGAATGACSLPGDSGPKRAPSLFGTCCDLQGAARGRCVSAELVPSDKQPLLSSETCGGAGLCLPATLAPPATSLPACTSDTGAAGACVPTCLLSLTQNLVTTQGSCQGWEKCVPCAVAGVSSGVCD